MIHWLLNYLHRNTDLPGMRIGEYLSFRSGAAIIISLLIVIFMGKRIIRYLRRKQIGEDIRDLGLEGQLQKKGTPTMGGIIIILAVLVPVLLFGDLSNIYIQLMLISTIWLGFIGGLDDYIKVFRHHKEGLKGLPVSMNPYDESMMEPNFWLSCMLIDKTAMCRQSRTDRKAAYTKEAGKPALSGQQKPQASFCLQRSTLQSGRLKRWTMSLLLVISLPAAAPIFWR